MLYRRVQQHLETWLAQCRDGHQDDGPVPPYAEREFRRYLDCGILAYGPAPIPAGGGAVPAAQSGRGTSPRLCAVAFIHRFGSTRNPHLHLHCVVINGVFDTTAAGDVVFHAATGIDASAIAAVEACVRWRLARAVSCAAACCRTMMRRAMANGNTAAASPWTARCASRPLTVPGSHACSETLARAPFALERLRVLDPERLL